MMEFGKIINVETNGRLFSKGYSLHDSSGKYLVEDRKYSILSKFKLTRRFLRAEITGFLVLRNDDQIMIAKKGLFIQHNGNCHFEKCFSMPRGSKPLNICIAPSGNLYFGEYFQNMDKQAVNIYCSEDNAQTWHIIFTFPKGSINHIHGLFYDQFTDRIWVLTGDRENECIIGYTKNEFKSFHEVFRGGQEYRSCQLFFYPDFIVFATDSQYIQNEIRYFDRKSLEIKTLVKIQGSAIKGGQSGNVSFLSTTVEPSKVNTDRFAHVWVTKDGLHWKDVYKAEKDRWPFIFQFGTFEFPQYVTPIKDKLYFSGRALKGHDQKTVCVDISDL